VPPPSTSQRRKPGHGVSPEATSNGARPEADAIESALCALQERYPKAPLLAIDTGGLTVEMPESVPRKENPVLRGGSGINSIPAEDRQSLISAFERVLERGTAECVLHPPAYEEVVWYGFDLRERHGVIVALLGADRDPTPAPPGADSRDMVRMGPPRFATIRKTERAVVSGVSGGITEILGWTAEEMVGRRSLEFVHPDDHELAIDNWMEMLAEPGPGRRIRQRARHKDGSWVWFEVTNNNLLHDPDEGCVVCEMVDISDEMAALEALRAREQLLNRLADTVPVGLVQIDTERRIVYTNDRLHEIVGVDPAPTAEAQLTTVVPDSRPALEQAIDSVLREGANADIEVACRRPEGEDLRFCTISLRALRHDDGTISGAIGCVADVTDGARMREELQFRATYDDLTGCHNRASIMAALEADIAQDRRHAERAAMFVDLDRFKSINDRHGHAAGDELLRQVASVLRDSVREKDLVGRTGGDEFLVICPDVGGSGRAMKLAARLARALREGICAVAGEPGCKVSIGVAWSSGDGTTADALVAAADAAMYKAKRAGTGEPELAQARLASLDS
jgi:diguanylate cyclase (GGDEF)-like protein/PAS domain S-box-containing protein